MSLGQSALANMGITQWPVGTTEEVKAAGYNTKQVASCCGGDRAKASGLRVCPMWDECQFNLKSMGGFKEVGGPRYIGYRYIDPADGTATEDIMRCHTWVMTMQAKADANAALRRRSGGKHGAVIRIIAQEGEEITSRYQLPVNAKGEVINVMPEMRDILEANKIKMSHAPGEQTVTQRFFELKRTVPRHPRPGEIQGDSYAHRVAMRDLDNEIHDRQYVDYGMREPEMPPLGEDQPVVDAPVRGGARNPWGRAGKPKNAEPE